MANTPKVVALEDVKHLVEGSSLGEYKNTLKKINDWLCANIKDDVRFYVGDRRKTDLPYYSEQDSDCEWYGLRH